MNTPNLGPARFASPLALTINDDVRIPQTIEVGAEPGYLFELAGPRAKLFFEPAHTRAAIVTCGGLCPGINNVIRSLFLELHHSYGVREVLGFRHGYQGLDSRRAAEPVVMTPEFVDHIHQEGGTVLGTSRGPVDTAVAVNNLIQRGVNMLFTIGGDGTQLGGNELFLEAQRRGHPLAVVGIPKTVDNDVAFVARSFGYFTAVEEASRVLKCAHTEAHSVLNGIALVKLMGRNAGFIAAGATVASQDVNFCLIPEVPFVLDGPRGLLAALERRILQRAHAVIVVAEGAGQELIESADEPRDASGNLKLKDIGQFLREKIVAHFATANIPATLRYFDPNYIIRSVPADAEDSMLCDQFARHAAHAAMAGKTGLVVGILHDRFIHVPTTLLTTNKQRVDPAGAAWRAVLAATGQAERFE
ncbi:MAG: ATP-dependent 6-phosphofructokinase [Verrucomicrobia bacterium]|nr:MAG: ATP-dependent 6-phosphofructokinase [Verrucomicrobiota bacterium]